MTTIQGLDPARATAVLWSGLRLAVVDCETTTSTHGDRVVSLAVATCRAGTVRGRWHTLVDPGVPISTHTTKIHGLTDDHVAGEPTFADIAPMLVALLTPPPGERLVVVAHNIGFDVPILRAELDRAGLAMPEHPVLDTMRLPAVVGVHPAGRSLSALLDVLGLANDQPHEALADATACAHAVVALLADAAAEGHTDFDELLAETSGTHTTLTVRRSRPGRTTTPPPAVIPDAHAAGHTAVLSRRHSKRTLVDWRAAVAECAELRCAYLADRVANAQAAASVLLDELHATLAERAAADDTAGAATVLGALAPLLVSLEPRNTRRLGQRRAALAWHDTWEARLAPLGRCRTDDPCPACRINDPCPLDTWPATLAAVALEDPAKMARGFFETTGKEAGTGAYTTWRSQGRPRLADAALCIVHQHWCDIGQRVRAEQLAQLAWKGGCRHPAIAERHAATLAATGRREDLTEAIYVCDQALALEGGSTDEAWRQLAARRAQLAGRFARSTERPSGHFDADGNPIPIRRHHPTTPRRTRPPRFARRH